MTRRNTYVCSDRNNTDRLSVIPNGKENRWGGWSTGKHKQLLWLWLLFTWNNFFSVYSSVIKSFLHVYLKHRAFYFTSFIHLLHLYPFSHLWLLPVCVCFGFGADVFIFISVSGWAAWQRWLMPLVPPRPLRRPCWAPRPVLSDSGTKPSAPCPLSRAGPLCLTPTTLWTTTPPSKTAGLQTPCPCLSPYVWAPHRPPTGPCVAPG